MRIRDYDTMYNEHTGGTETHTATDEMIRKTKQDIGLQQRFYEEGFAASGLEGERVEMGGHIRVPERLDALRLQPLSVPRVEREAEEWQE
jgi:hypothetical protein